LLLLHANEPVSAERLIDELWPEQQPEHGSKTLQVYVSRLRKTIGPERLRTTPAGYVIDVAAGDLDSSRFEELTAEGRAALAAGNSGRGLSLLTDALALWRGPALADFRFDSFAQSEIRRLEELQATARADLIDARMNRGDANGVKGDLQELIDENPLWERPRGQLMLALYRDGRQAAALELYRSTRRLLADELGVDPSPELQALERGILNHDPALRTPTTPRALVRRAGRRLLIGGALIASAAAAGLVAILLATRDEHAPLVAARNSLAVVDPHRNEVVAVVTVGVAPRGVAFGTRHVWTANAGEGTVSQIDPSRLRVVRTIGLGARATALVESDNVIWIATGTDNTVVRVNARSGGVLGRTRISGNPSASAYAIGSGPGGVWVGSGSQVAKLDPSSGTVVSRLPYRAGINDIAVDGSSVWVASSAETVARFSPTARRLAAEVGLGVIPEALVIGEGSMWAASTFHQPTTKGRPRYRAAVWKIDPVTTRVIQTTPFGRELPHPPTLDIALGAGAVWATNYEEGTVVRIDQHTGQVVKTIRIGGHPSGIAVGGKRVWVTVS
jgi:YVTN family beta-propeller protein